MDGLRWLLLFFGLLVIAGVYLYSRRERSKPKPLPETSAKRREPTLGDDADEALPYDPEYADAAADDEPAAAGDSDRERPQKIVTLRLIARNGGAFPGDELLLSMRGIGMRPGKFGIYHRFEGSDEERTIFSAASLVEPGSFDFENIKAQQIPGISLFMVLPGPVEGAEAFDLMMAAARALAQTLDADLLDESGSTLSIQRERYMREEVIQFEHSIKVA